MRGLLLDSPETAALVEKAERDMRARLDPAGMPLHLNNDYERHLFARRLRLEGRSREEARQALIDLGLEDVMLDRRVQYVNDILDSILVGYSNKPLPIYGEAK